MIQEDEKGTTPDRQIIAGSGFLFGSKLCVGSSIMKPERPPRMEQMKGLKDGDSAQRQNSSPPAPNQAFAVCGGQENLEKRHLLWCIEPVKSMGRCFVFKCRAPDTRSNAQVVNASGQPVGFT